MGRASRRKRADYDIAGHTRRSAWVAVVRELEAELEVRTDPDITRAFTVALKLLQDERLRIVQFESSQAASFAGMGAGLLAAAELERPPFPVTFYDFDFARVGPRGVTIVGALVADEDVTHDKWMALIWGRDATGLWRTWTRLAGVGLDAAGLPKTSAVHIGPRLQEDGEFGLDDDSIEPILLACGALTMLSSANVTLVESQPRPRNTRAAHLTHYDIAVRVGAKTRYVGGQGPHSTPDWSHRWEVAGHFKHFRQGAIFDSNPDRRIRQGSEEYVRIWCPPHVKGPENKPLVPKVRRVVPSVVPLSSEMPGNTRAPKPVAEQIPEPQPPDWPDS